MIVLKSLRERCYPSFKMGGQRPKFFRPGMLMIDSISQGGFCQWISSVRLITFFLGPHSLEPSFYWWNLFYLITLTGLKNRCSDISRRGNTFLPFLFCFKLPSWPTLGLPEALSESLVPLVSRTKSSVLWFLGRDGNFLKVYLNSVYLHLVILIAERIICLGMLTMVTGAEVVCILHIIQFIWIYKSESYSYNRILFFISQKMVYVGKTWAFWSQIKAKRIWVKRLVLAIKCLRDLGKLITLSEP